MSSIKIGDRYVVVFQDTVHVCNDADCQGDDMTFHNTTWHRFRNYHNRPWRSMNKCVEKAYKKALSWTAKERKINSNANQAIQYLNDLKETFEV